MSLQCPTKKSARWRWRQPGTLDPNFARLFSSKKEDRSPVSDEGRLRPVISQSEAFSPPPYMVARSGCAVSPLGKARQIRIGDIRRKDTSCAPSFSTCSARVAIVAAVGDQRTSIQRSKRRQCIRGPARKLVERKQPLHQVQIRQRQLILSRVIKCPNSARGSESIIPFRGIVGDSLIPTIGTPLRDQPFHDFQYEAAAIFDRSSILIRPLIDAIDQELIR